MSNGSTITRNGKNKAWSFLYNPAITTGKVVKFKIGTGTNTPSETDTDLQIPVVGWNAGSDYQIWLSGYPTFDTVNKRVTVRGLVTETQANGNTLTETGEFMTDNVMFSRTVYTGIVKNSQIRIIYEWTSNFV